MDFVSSVVARLTRSNLSEVVKVPASSLVASDSPRLDGEDIAHAEALANTDAPLPPIVVHRHTMRVIDGMHRLRAAQLSGKREIDARFFDGSESDAFVLAVEANVTHGLPLSAADREAAAMRIILSHPELSDRAIAASAGLSAKSVAAIRARTRESAQLTARVGRDGRVRPLDATIGRQRAYEVIQANPGATLREIASEAGVALGTARDVRVRVQRGENPLPPRLMNGADADTAKRPADTAPPPSGATPIREASYGDPTLVLQSLMKDPSLRFSERGRSLLRWLNTNVASPERLSTVIDAVPPHCANQVASLALECAAMWNEVAEKMNSRAACVS